VTGEFARPALLLWLGSIFWVIGYDTLYAIQDIEDDELVGVKSSARALGEKAQLGIGICYALALAGWAGAIWSVRPDWVALLALLPAGVHLGRQVAQADPKDGPRALALFRSNRFTGLLLFLGFLAVGLSSVE
jgi:4-hydroxybenzoate polyprenyltransferase